MNFAQPLALALLGLSIPLVAGYLHRRKRRVKPVPSAFLFRVIAGENTPTRRAFAAPRHWLSLVAVLLALIALALASADLEPEAEKPHNTIIVLDTSASMAARGVGTTRTRLDDAVDQIRDAVTELPAGDKVALITAGTHPRVRIGLTEDHDRVVELAGSAEAGGSSESVASALKIADAMATATQAEVVLVSDGVGVGLPALEHPPVFVGVGTGGPNVGINALATREADALGLGEIFLGLTADISEPREVEVALRVDDKVVDILPIRLEGRGETQSLHRVRLPEGEQITATLQNHGDDILSLDDVATAPRRVGAKVSVLLVAKSRVSFTAEALRLHPRVQLEVAGPFDAPRKTEYDLIIEEALLEGTALPDAPKLLALGVPPERVGLTQGERVPAPEILRWSFDHRLFRFVDVAQVELPRATTLVLAADQTALIDSERGPIAAQTKFQDRDTVYFGFAPHESDLVLRVGFVNLMANVVEWAAPIEEDGAAPRGSAILPATESRVEPVTTLPGVSRSTLSRSDSEQSPLWRLLVWIALGLVVAEGVLPFVVTGATRLRSRLRGGPSKSAASEGGET